MNNLAMLKVRKNSKIIVILISLYLSAVCPPPYTFYCIFITFLCDNFSQINSKLQKIIYFYNFPGQFFKIGLKFRKNTEKDLKFTFFLSAWENFWRLKEFPKRHSGAKAPLLLTLNFFSFFSKRVRAASVVLWVLLYAGRDTGPGPGVKREAKQDKTTISWTKLNYPLPLRFLLLVSVVMERRTQLAIKQAVLGVRHWIFKK